MKLGRLVLALGALAYGATNAAAQDPVSAHEVKAAFIYNFAKFAQWPADGLESDKQLPVCVIGDAAVAAALERTSQGHTIQGREVRVRIVKTGDALLACRILYIGGMDAKTAAQLIGPLSSLPVLTISDSDSFAATGGIAELFMENGRMRFAINVTAANRARVVLSAKLLSLAKNVKDGNHVQR